MPKPRLVVKAPPAKSWLIEAINRGRSEAFCDIAEIGADDARLLLGNNPENRALNVRLLSKLASDLVGGRWQFNGESIVVASSGELNDGQHRLEAVLQTGIPIRSVIAFGVPRESRATLDMGRVRSMADQLAVAGVASAALVSAIARVVMGWERGGGEDFRQVGWLTISEMIDRALTDELLGEATRYASSRYHFANSILPGSAIGACFYLFARVDHGAATDFMDRVCIGDALDREDAAYATRRALLMVDHHRRNDLCAIVLRGWAFHRAGKRPTPKDFAELYPLPDIATTSG
jgi:hypothetical protein